jgi:hypothetical protein
MKTNDSHYKPLIVSCICVFLFIYASYSQETGRFYSKSKYDTLLLKANDLPMLLKDVKTNSTLQYERLAAFVFHRIINQYRVSKKLKPLAWDDRLWLAARNHNIYLTHSNLRSENAHVQIKGKRFFTGVDFLDRIKYVFSEKSVGETEGSGENIVSNSGGWILGLEDCAIWDPEYALQSWKHSPGHNLNMLDKRHISHGTSFYIFNRGDSFYIFATSVFSNCKSGSKPIVIDWDVSLAKKYAHYKGKR